MNRGAKEVECETLCPLRSEANFPGNPMRPVLHQEREAERARSLKIFARKLAFCLHSCTAN